MCQECTVAQALQGITDDLSEALNTCDASWVNDLLDEMQMLIGVEAMQPLLRAIITRSVEHIGFHHGQPVAPAAYLN